MHYTATRTKISLIAFAVLMVAVLLSGCQRRSEQQAVDQKEKSPEIVYFEVQDQAIESIVSLPTTIENFETAMLMPRVEAYVEKVLVEIGDEVTAGQVLVQLTAPELQQRVVQHQATLKTIHAGKKMALAELKAAKSNSAMVLLEQTLKLSERDRLGRLVSTGAIGGQRLEEAEAALGMTNAEIEMKQNAIEMGQAKLLKGAAQLAVEQAKLKEAESLADYLVIKAPFSGIVVQRMVDPGNLVRPDQDDDAALLTVAKIDKLRAIVYATPDVAGQLATGQTANFVADSAPEKVFTAQLSRTAGAFNMRSRMMRAEIDLPNQRDPDTGKRPLQAGAYGLITIVTASATQPVVPESALRRMGRQTSVVVISDGVCLVTPVEVGIVSGKLVGIASGIMAGDRVVTQNPEAIKNEQRVTEAQMKQEK